MGKKLTQEEVIKRFKEVHGNKYDYSKVRYLNTTTKVEILCSKHGSFFQLPSEHWKGSGCPKCNKYRIRNNNEIIDEFKKVHSDKYDYSKINYIKANTKVEIICTKHGSFFQTPIQHKNGQGCPFCARKNSNLNTKESLIKFKKVHGDKYDYSKVNYINSMTKVEIRCPEHGSFFQRPNTHSNGSGCPKCLESIGEKRIRIFLEENNIKYFQEYRFKDCKFKKELPFDFYLEDLNTVIEYDGKQHFEPVDYFGGLEGFLKTQRDKIKTEYCLENNIRIIRIGYFEDVEEVLEVISDNEECSGGGCTL